jgi:uroporphyrinogen decarboxylase
LNIWRDEWGVIWDRHIDRDIGTQKNIVLENLDVDGLHIPDPSNPERFMHFKPLIEAQSNRYILVKISRCLFERGWSLRGMENLMMDFIINPLFVHELFESIADFNLKLLENLKSYPIDGVRFSDDWGGQRGLLMSPETWRIFIKPYLKRMYDRAHSLGYDVFIHTCGDVTLLLDDLIEIGVDVFNPFQPEVMDIGNIIERYAGRLAFNGGLSIQKTLPFGDPDEVRREVRNRLKLAREHGGYIISPAHDMPPDIPFENIQTLLKELHAQT